MTRLEAPASAPRRRHWAVAAVAALALAAGGCATAPAVVAGAGGIVAEERAMPYFTELHVGEAYDVHVRARSTPDVTLYTDASLLPYIQTSITKDTLSIGTQRGTTLQPTAAPHRHLHLGAVGRDGHRRRHARRGRRSRGDVFTARFDGAGRATLSGAVGRLKDRGHRDHGRGRAPARGRERRCLDQRGRQRGGHGARSTRGHHFRDRPGQLHRAAARHHPTHHRLGRDPAGRLAAPESITDRGG